MPGVQKQVRTLSFINLAVVAIAFAPGLVGIEYSDSTELYVQGAAAVWLLGANLYISVFVYRQGLTDMRRRHEQENRDLAERQQRPSGS